MSSSRASNIGMDARKVLVTRINIFGANDKMFQLLDERTRQTTVFRAGQVIIAERTTATQRRPAGRELLNWGEKKIGSNRHHPQGFPVDIRSVVGLTVFLRQTTKRTTSQDQFFTQSQLRTSIHCSVCPAHRCGAAARPPRNLNRYRPGCVAQSYNNDTWSFVCVCVLDMLRPQ